MSEFGVSTPSTRIDEYRQGQKEVLDSFFNKVKFDELLVPWSEENQIKRQSTGGVLRHLGVKFAEDLGMETNQAENNPHRAMTKVIENILLEIGTKTFDNAYVSAKKQGAVNPHDVASEAAAIAIGQYILPLANAETQEQKIQSADFLASALSGLNDEGKHYVNITPLHQTIERKDANGKVINIALWENNNDSYKPKISQGEDYNDIFQDAILLPLGDTTMTGGVVYSALDGMGADTLLEAVGARREYERQNPNALNTIRDMAYAIGEGALVGSLTAASTGGLGMVAHSVVRGAVNEYVQEEGTMGKQYFGDNEYQKAHTGKLIEDAVFNGVTMGASLGIGHYLSSAVQSSWKLTPVGTQLQKSLFLKNGAEAVADTGLDIAVDMTAFHTAKGLKSSMLDSEEVFVDNTRNMYEMLFNQADKIEGSRGEAMIDAWSGFLAKKFAGRFGSSMLSKYIGRQKFEDVLNYEEASTSNKAFGALNKFLFPKSNWSNVDLNLRNKYKGLTLQEALQNEKYGYEFFAREYLEAEIGPRKHQGIYRMADYIAGKIPGLDRANAGNPIQKYEEALGRVYEDIATLNIPESKIDQLAIQQARLIADDIRDLGRDKIIVGGAVDDTPIKEIIHAYEGYVNGEFKMSKQAYMQYNAATNKNLIRDELYSDLKDQGYTDAEIAKLTNKVQYLWNSKAEYMTDSNYSAIKNTDLVEYGKKFNAKHANLFTARIAANRDFGQTDMADVKRRAQEAVEIAKKYLPNKRSNYDLVFNVSPEQKTKAYESLVEVAKGLNDILNNNGKATDYLRFRAQMAVSADVKIKHAWDNIKNAIEQKDARGLTDEGLDAIINENFTNINIYRDRFGSKVMPTINNIHQQIKDNAVYNKAIEKATSSKDRWGSKVIEMVRSQAVMDGDKAMKNKTDVEVLFKAMNDASIMSEMDEARFTRVLEPTDTVNTNFDFITKMYATYNPYHKIPGEAVTDYQKAETEKILNVAEYVFGRSTYDVDTGLTTYKITDPSGNEIELNQKELTSLANEIIARQYSETNTANEKQFARLDINKANKMIAYMYYKLSLLNNPKLTETINNMLPFVTHRDNFTGSNTKDIENFAVKSSVNAEYITDKQVLTLDNDNVNKLYNAAWMVMTARNSNSFTESIIRRVIADDPLGDIDNVLSNMSAKEFEMDDGEYKSYFDIDEKFRKAAASQNINYDELTYKILTMAREEDDAITFLQNFLVSLDKGLAESFKSTAEDPMNDFKMFTSMLAIKIGNKVNQEMSWNPDNGNILHKFTAVGALPKFYNIAGVNIIEINNGDKENLKYTDEELWRDMGIIPMDEYSNALSVKYIKPNASDDQGRYEQVLNLMRIRTENNIKKMADIAKPAQEKTLELINSGKLNWNNLKGNTLIEKVQDMYQQLQENSQRNYQDVLSHDAFSEASLKDARRTVGDFNRDILNKNDQEALDKEASTYILKDVNDAIAETNNQIKNIMSLGEVIDQDKITSLRNKYNALFDKSNRTVQDIANLNNEIENIFTNKDFADYYKVKEIATSSGYKPDPNSSIYDQSIQMKLKYLDLNTGNIKELVSKYNKERPVDQQRVDTTGLIAAIENTMRGNFILPPEVSERISTIMGYANKFPAAYETLQKLTDKYATTLQQIEAESKLYQSSAAIAQSMIRPTATAHIDLDSKKFIQAQLDMFKDMHKTISGDSKPYKTWKSLYNFGIIGDNIYQANHKGVPNIGKRLSLLMKQNDPEDETTQNLKMILNYIKDKHPNMPVYFLPTIEDMESGQKYFDGQVPIHQSLYNAISAIGLEPKMTAVVGNALGKMMFTPYNGNAYIQSVIGKNAQPGIILFRDTFKMADADFERAILDNTTLKTSTITYKDINGDEKEATVTYRESADTKWSKSYAGKITKDKLLNTVFHNIALHAPMNTEAKQMLMGNSGANLDPVARYLLIDKIGGEFNRDINSAVGEAITGGSDPVNMVLNWTNVMKNVQKAFQKVYTVTGANSRAAALVDPTDEYRKSAYYLIPSKGLLLKNKFGDKNPPLPEMAAWNTNETNLIRIGDETLIKTAKKALSKLADHDPVKIATQEQLNRFIKARKSGKPLEDADAIKVIMNFLADKEIIHRVKTPDGEYAYYAKTIHYPLVKAGQASQLSLIAGIIPNSRDIEWSANMVGKANLDFDGDLNAMVSAENSMRAIRHTMKQRYTTYVNDWASDKMSDADIIFQHNRYYDDKTQTFKGLGEESKIKSDDKQIEDAAIKIGLANNIVQNTLGYVKALLHIKGLSSSTLYNVKDFAGMFNAEDQPLLKQFENDLKMRDMNPERFSIVRRESNKHFKGLGSITEAIMSDKSIKIDGKKINIIVGNDVDEFKNRITYIGLIDNTKGSGRKLIHINSYNLSNIMATSAFANHLLDKMEKARYNTVEDKYIEALNTESFGANLASNQEIDAGIVKGIFDEMRTNDYRIVSYEQEYAQKDAGSTSAVSSNIAYFADTNLIKQNTSAVLAATAFSFDGFHKVLEQFIPRSKLFARDPKDRKDAEYTRVESRSTEIIIDKIAKMIRSGSADNPKALTSNEYKDIKDFVNNKLSTDQKFDFDDILNRKYLYDRLQQYYFRDGVPISKTADEDEKTKMDPDILTFVLTMRKYLDYTQWTRNPIEIAKDVNIPKEEVGLFFDTATQKTVEIDGKLVTKDIEPTNLILVDDKIIPNTRVNLLGMAISMKAAIMKAYDAFGGYYANSNALPMNNYINALKSLAYTKAVNYKSVNEYYNHLVHSFNTMFMTSKKSIFSETDFRNLFTEAGVNVSIQKSFVSQDAILGAKEMALSKASGTATTEFEYQRMSEEYNKKPVAERFADVVSFTDTKGKPLSIEEFHNKLNNYLELTRTEKFDPKQASNAQYARRLASSPGAVEVVINTLTEPSKVAMKYRSMGLSLAVMQKLQNKSTDMDLMITKDSVIEFAKDRLHQSYKIKPGMTGALDLETKFSLKHMEDC